LVPSLHNFTYDAYFYGTDMSLSQVMEFDVSMYFDGISLVWGNQCRIAGGNEWDIWDNVTSRWVPTGFACDPISNGWNHVTIQVQRESDNTLLFQSITLNGVVNTINQYYAPSTCPPGWWGITVNYQMDGNSKQSAYTTYLDNFSFSYW
jgi:alpha-glucuronidase